MSFPKPSANEKAVEPHIPCTCTAHDNPWLHIPSPEQQTHGYAKMFMWIAIVRDVRDYLGVSRIPANQVVPQGGMQQKPADLAGDGSQCKGVGYAPKGRLARGYYERILDFLLRNAQVVHQQNPQPHHSCPMAMGKARKAKVNDLSSTVGVIVILLPLGLPLVFSPTNQLSYQPPPLAF